MAETQIPGRMIKDGSIAEIDLGFTNNTTANVSTTAHGLQPMLPNDANLFMDGTGSYSRIKPRIATTANNATPTPNADTTDAYHLTALSGAAAFGAPTGSPASGQNLIIRIKDNGTARALSFDSIYRAIGVTLPTTTVLGKTLYLGMKYNAADTKWDVLAIGQEA